MKSRAITFCSLMLVAGILLCLSGCGGGGGGVGGRGGDGVTPVLTMSNPQSAGRVSDVDFRKDDFYIQINYLDTSPMQFGSLSVTLQMDSGTATDITSYFSQVGETTIKSSSLNTFTKTLFDLPTNDTNRTMTIKATIQDSAQNTAQLTAIFTVYAIVPALPPTPGS